MKVWVLVLLVMSLGFSLVVVNSFDGRDVVSGTYYGLNVDEEVLFVPLDGSESALYGKIGQNGQVTLIQSAESPILIGMKNSLENKGNTVTLISSVDPYATNLQLAESSKAESFVLVDPVYGYNTVSVLPYAKEKGMYLIFVDDELKEPVVEFLKGKDPKEVLLYGYIDENVKSALGDSGITYTEINNGDKFDDNIELLEEYFKINPSKHQVILSDGNAMEATIMGGEDPIVLISPIISTDTASFVEEQVQSGQIKVALVVDSEYAQTAYDLKETINQKLGEDALTVLVKFGQSVPSAGGAMLPVDLFPLRGPILGLDIEKAEYNTASETLEVTYKNTGNVPEYVKTQIEVYVDGVRTVTLGDEEPFSIGRDELLGKGYALEVVQGDIIVEITSLFGSSKKSMENGIQVTLDAGKVAFTDVSSLGINGFNQDEESGDLFVTYENGGSSAVYFRPDVTVELGGKSTKMKDDDLYELSSGESQIVKFPGVLTNSGTVEVVAGADYGSREAFLDNRVEQSHTFEVEVPMEEELEGTGFDMNLLFILIIVVLVIVVLYLFLAKKKEKK